MRKLLDTAICSIPKLDIDEFCRINNVDKDELYKSAIEMEDETIGNLFLNRYPRKINKELRLEGENIIKQVLKTNNIKLSEIAGTYDVSKRWILRVIKKVEKSDPELYKLYKRYRNKALSPKDEELINNMPIGDIQTQNRNYPVVKRLTTKTHEYDKIFKTRDEIAEEIHEKIAKFCEDPEELEKKLNDPDTEKRIENRWKKEKVLMDIFKECSYNLELFHIELGNQSTSDRIRQAFNKIDEEDGMLDIIRREDRFGRGKGE